jgi:homoserine dehydrogenase
VNVLMGSVITPHYVARTGISGVSAADVADALGRNQRIKLVASASRQGGKIRARVEPEWLEPGDPLAGVADLQNALYFQTDLLGEIGVVQRSGDLTQTAYALVADLSAISQRLQDTQ